MLIMVKILLVDQDGMYSEGLRLIIDKENDMEVMGTAANENQFMNMAKILEPDVVMINTEIQGISVIKLTAFIKQTADQAKIIYILSSSNKKIIIEGIKAGAEGFLLSHYSYRNFVQSIRDVYNENYVMAGEIAKIIINHVKMPALNEKEIMNQKLKNIGIHTTKRELDIICLLFMEKKNKEIAEKLQLSESTIRDYVSKTYNKIGKYHRKEVVEFLNEVMYADDLSNYDGLYAKTTP